MSCERKVRYKSKGEASDTAKRQRSRTRRKLFVYECHECGGWHLTKMPPTLYRQRTRAAQDGPA